MQLEKRFRGWRRGVMALLLTALAAGVGAGDDRDDRKDWSSDWSAVFTLTNDPSGNELAVFRLDNKGRMSKPVLLPTGGDGTGGGLGNQGALAMSEDKNFLYAVNPGSGTITVFRLTQSGPQVLQTIDAGGKRPISIALRRNLLYVLNADGSVSNTDVDGIAGFVVRANGRLRPLAGSVAHLSARTTGPAQIAFSPSGDALIVTEKNTNTLTAFSLNKGVPAETAFEPSAGKTPFGFEFSPDGFLIVSEAQMGVAGAGTVSSYGFDDDDGTFEILSAAVPTKQSAPCWIAVTENGEYAYTTNTASNSVTGYKIGRKGKLTRLDDGGVTAETGAAPTDMTYIGNSVLFVLNRNDGSVGSYTIKKGGALHALEVVGGLDGKFFPSGLVVR